LIVTRRAFATALSLAAIVALAPLHLNSDARAQDAMAALVAKPVSLLLKK